jgi:hypothetical protein
MHDPASDSDRYCGSYVHHVNLYIRNSRLPARLRVTLFQVAKDLFLVHDTHVAKAWPAVMYPGKGTDNEMASALADSNVHYSSAVSWGL